MISELKGNHLSRVLHAIRIYNKDPITNESKVPIKNLPSGQNNTYIKRYLLIDFYEWLKLLEKDQVLANEIQEWDFISRSLIKYRRFINLTTKTLNAESTSIIIEKYLEYSYLEDLIKIYEIFMREMERVQVSFLKLYTKVNNSTNPVAIIPWSYGLNRICSDLLIIEEDGLVESKEIVEEKGRTEGKTSTYKVKICKLDDYTNRYISNSPIKLYHFKTDLKSENLLPEDWLYFFDKNVTRDMAGYLPRLELIKGLYSQYSFYGLNRLPESTTPQIGLINYPFLLDQAIGDLKQITGEDGINYEFMWDTTIEVIPKDNILLP